MADDKTREILLERRLDHGSGEAHAFYRNFSGTVLVGIEAIAGFTQRALVEMQEREKILSGKEKNRAPRLAHSKCLLTEPTPS